MSKPAYNWQTLKLSNVAVMTRKLAGEKDQTRRNTLRDRIIPMLEQADTALAERRELMEQLDHALSLLKLVTDLGIEFVNDDTEAVLKELPHAHTTNQENTDRSDAPP